MREPQHRGALPTRPPSGVRREGPPSHLRPGDLEKWAQTLGDLNFQRAF